MVEVVDRLFSNIYHNKPYKPYGGRGGIRTHGTVTRTSDFESDAFNHSATLPAVDFIGPLVVFAKARLTFVACIHANGHRQPKNLAKVVGGEFILLRPDRDILRQTPYQGQD